METLLQSVRIVVILTVLTGGLYPLAVTFCAKALFPKQANGSLIVDGQGIRGSALLAQKFVDPKYFWPRPSGGDYATIPSGASNKGPTSADLARAIEERRKSLGSNAPVDLLTASGSGLDPHISPEGARFQISRIAAERNLPAAKVSELVAKSFEPRQFGIFGEPRVNVLALNRALDKLH